MTSIVSIQASIDAIHASMPSQGVDISHHDAGQFRQALDRISQDSSPFEPIETSIASIEKQDRQYLDALSHASNARISAAGVSAMLDLSIQQQKMRIAIGTDVCVIAGITKGINELTHMQ